ncbi:ethylbenzene dehydrogenase-related protein, partial [Candidatus Aminicenantes bacterium AH-873-B07]|nr:ethylbenzene dehydrogenase-related protein [Candidatus Aminicenantes bacterium AH-873-B07]
ARIPYGTDERDIFVRAAYNDSEVVFILEYEDSTKNVGGFVNPDAAAILFVKKNSPETKQMMGYGAKANIWHWLADRNFQKYKQGKKYINVVRELIAQGPGTQIEMTVQNVKGKGIYKNGKWKIVFKRELKSKYEDEFELGPGIPFEIAFAQWEGQKMESFSKKSISILRTLIWERK